MPDDLAWARHILMRATLRYGDRQAPVTAPAGSVDATEPTAGWFRFKLKSDGHPVGIYLWYGPPHDPETGEIMDRSWRWQARCNGEPIVLDRVWPGCAREPISEDEHDYLMGLHLWGKENAPDGPQAQPWRPIDLLSAPLPF